MAPSSERYAELRSLNEALNRRLRDLESQIKLFRDKHKLAKLCVQTEKEEVKRLRIVVERQRSGREIAITEKNELQAKVEERDREVVFVPTALLFISDYIDSRSNF